MNRIITSVLFGLVGLNAVIMADPSRPRLVVGIVVDQLRTDYVEYLKNLFGDKGFNRLMKEGVYMRDIDFKASDLDAVSATAMLYTGNYPNATGVPSAVVCRDGGGGLTMPLEDKTAIGNFTNETFSPVALRLSTLSDEVKIDGAGVGAVYAIAPDPQQAIIMAGHAGNCAVWLNDNTGKWATSTYYHDSPQAVSTRNYNHPLSARVDTMQWKPSLSLDKYPGLPAQKKAYPFRYTFPGSDREVYRRLIASPMVNTEITDLAIDILDGLNLGRRGEAIDMLNVAYTAAPFKYASDSDYRLELEDSYLRLDSQIGRLFDAIDKKVGLENTLIYLSSTGYYEDTLGEDAAFRIPTGEFSVKRATSLLNSYLSAKYGNADYIDSYYDGHLYLDHAVIGQKKLTATEVADDARAFLCKMSGVADAYTLPEILGRGSDALEGLRLATDPKACGDIYIEYTPGWTVTDDLRYPEVKKQIRSSMCLTPAFILAPGVAPKVIDATVEAVRIAPTVSSALRIRAPNGVAERPITL
ncbi:MAG: alkaline phosphatase family protein [Bacteroidales bacterium]|nr:alkaline phosphatase family protein [Bacteroidales bacterium]